MFEHELSSLPPLPPHWRGNGNSSTFSTTTPDTRGIAVLRVDKSLYLHHETVTKNIFWLPHLHSGQSDDCQGVSGAALTYFGGYTEYAPLTYQITWCIKCWGCRANPVKVSYIWKQVSVIGIFHLTRIVFHTKYCSSIRYWSYVHKKWVYSSMSVNFNYDSAKSILTSYKIPKKIMACSHSSMP